MLRVLNGHSLETKALLYPESMGLNLSERDSTASPTADRDEPQMQVGDWAQDMDEPGAGIVWRVRTVDTQYNTETITYTLEHMINSLADRILPDEVKADDMGGSGGSCTAKQAAQYILGQQSDWVLGDFDYESVSNPYRFSGETLKAALETISNSLEDPIWEYDFSTYPFKLHIRQQSDTVDSELRAYRNLTTLKYTIDRTRMYTRFYPVGKNNLKPDGKYVSKNEAIYGRVDKTETDQSKDTEAKLIAWANERLERHAEPLVTVTISGLDLSESTGESLDRIKISRYKCRVPLPAYNTTIVEKVTKLSWRDKIKDKESVTATLANALADVQSIIKEEKSKSGGGGRTAAELNYGIETTIGNVESGLYTRITQTAYEIRQEAHDEARSLRSIISQTAESIRLIVENDVGSLRSQIIQTAESIRMEVSNEAASLRSSITQTAESIRMEVADEASSIRSQIVQTAESIRTEVSDEAASIRSQIVQTASSIRMEVSGVADSTGHVTAASIALAINDAGQGVATINANKIYMLGQTIADQITADYIATEIAKLSSLTVSSIACTGTIGANELQVGTLKFRTSSGSGYSFSDLKDLFVTSVSVTGPVDNVYTLKYFTANSTEGTSGGTFSRAVSSFEGSWSGNHYQVTVSPQNQTGGDTYIYVSSPSWESITDGKKATISVYYIDGEGNRAEILPAVINMKLTGSWSGNTYTASMKHGNTEIYSIATNTFVSSPTWGTGDDVNKATVSFYYMSNGSRAEILPATIDASSRYTAADAASGTAVSRHGSGFSWDFTITRGDGTKKTLTIDCSDIYTAARDGYTLGIFTQQTITLQGSQTSAITTQGTAATTTTVTLQGSQTASLTLQGEAQTVYEEVSSGGTVYYTAGTAKTYYDAGTAGTYYDAGTAVTVYPGNGGSFTPQGSAGPRLKDDGSARHYDVNGNLIGNHHWYHVVSSGGTQYYNAGSGTKYARGTGYSITPIGTAHTITPVGAGHVVTPIGSTSKRLSSVTRYKAGTNVGKLYNAGSVATYYPATETLYKAGTNIGKLYNAGTISTDYYTKA